MLPSSNPSLTSESEFGLTPRRSDWTWWWLGPLLIALTVGAIGGGIVVLRTMRKPPPADTSTDDERTDTRPSPDKENEGDTQPKPKDQEKPERKESPPGNPAAEFIRRVTPGQSWREDDDLLELFGAPAAFRHTEHGGGAVILLREYEKSSPTEVELLDRALELLPERFDLLTWNLKAHDPTSQVGTWVALAVEFEGTERGRGAMIGEAILTTADGVACWFFTWAPANQRVVPAEHEWRPYEFWETEFRTLIASGRRKN